jgi:lactate 2-monooxygenase
MTTIDLSVEQRTIYDRGINGDTPALPVDLTVLEDLARERLPSEVFGFLAGGAGRESTVQANRRAFERWAIVPRMLRDVGTRDHSSTVLATSLPAPLLLAPIGTQRSTHPDGELAVARAAHATGVPLIVSTVSSYPLERIAEELAGTPGWFQFYWPSDPDLATSLLHRAYQAGYQALVVTLDNVLMGWRPRDLQRGFLPFAGGDGLANYLSDPTFQLRVGARSEADMDLRKAVTYWSEVSANPSLTWEDIGLLHERWPGPIVLKGILHPDDARRALDHGIDGIAVSNHGGRQVDGAIAALDALPSVVEVVDGRVTVLFDGGIRSGADMVKALALGADAVLLGRPYIYGLGLAGQDGVQHVIRTLLADYDLTCGLAGHTTPRQLGPDALARTGPVSPVE